MLFPSMDEGLGIVVLEAQAMGVPTVASDCVPPDVSVLPGMVEFLPLDAPLARWIPRFNAKLQQPPLNRTEAVRCMQASDFSVDQSLQTIMHNLLRQTVRSLGNDTARRWELSHCARRRCPAVDPLKETRGYDCK